MGNNCGCPGGNNNYTDIFNPFTSCFFSIPPKQYTLLATLLGLLFIDNLDTDQQNSLGNFFVSIGQSILTSAAQEQVVQDSNSKNKELRNQIQNLKKQISMLEKELD